ncbi:hypothetical protein FEM48_Zijuj06G0182000 [Ziziphus jujuba var. spinosa]|uniref:BHLH domain-containing protein n=1 Tax=Ziziphus jujuba var. spinosa TaxID=714518 RepID=A0A978VAU7_ZIZJJ|nr:hypothetical protein FEM48_Zijuj06G0182000 [Ziziphus jujuba var. spinosa]
MQSTPGGSSSSGGGGGVGGGVSRVGLARFRSAPASWLEALLDDEEEDPLKPNQCLTQLLADNSPAPSSTNTVPFAPSADPGGSFEAGFARQNSSPADFLGNSSGSSETYFSNFGIPANFDLVSPNINVSSTTGSKRKGEQASGQVSGLLDMEMEKLLEDSVPCRVRAKRGFATHPRSIAERVRRTRISDRIRKLQELVPNMDKQTNTADMLEEAVEYVKHLQRQIQELTEHQRKCKCIAKE